MESRTVILDLGPCLAGTDHYGDMPLPEHTERGQGRIEGIGPRVEEGSVEIREDNRSFHRFTTLPAPRSTAADRSRSAILSCDVSPYL
jgi:hypothetical protein